MDDQNAFRMEVADTRNCIERDCGKEFQITNGEKEFFDSKNMSLPKRCKPCRAKVRAQREAQANQN